MATRLGNINLFVHNMDQAVQFYVDVIGLTLDKDRSALPGFALLQAGESTLTLQDRSASEAAFGPAESIEIGFEVDDVAAVHQRFADRKLPVEDAQQMGWGGGFNAKDVDGHRLTIFRMNDGADPQSQS